MNIVECQHCRQPLANSADTAETQVQCPRCLGQVQMPPFGADHLPEITPQPTLREASEPIIAERQTLPQTRPVPGSPSKRSEGSSEHRPSQISFGSVQRHPLREWIVYSTIIGLTLSFLCGPLFFRAITSDSSGICLSILILFVTALVKNFLDARFVDQQVRLADIQIRELVDLNDIVAFLKKRNRTLFYDHVKNLYEISRRNPEVRQDNLVVLLQSRLNSRTKLTDLFSGLLVTLGLVGTIIGLISSVSGLGTVMDSVGTDQDQLLTGLHETLGGMGTAFYTTLLGAILGAVALRLLGSVVDTNVDYLVAHIAELSEVYIVPTLRRTAERTRRKEEEQGARKQEDKNPNEGYALQ